MKHFSLIGPSCYAKFIDLLVIGSQWFLKFSIYVLHYTSQHLFSFGWIFNQNTYFTHSSHYITENCTIFCEWFDCQTYLVSLTISCFWLLSKGLCRDSWSFPHHVAHSLKRKIQWNFLTGLNCNLQTLHETRIVRYILLTSAPSSAIIEKNFWSRIVEAFTLKTLEAFLNIQYILNIMMRALSSRLSLKMFGYVIVFFSEDIQNLSHVIIIVKTLQWNFLTSKIYYVKSVRFWSYSSPHFPAFGLNMERYAPYSVRIWDNADQNNSEYGHFLRSDIWGTWWNLVKFTLNLSSLGSLILQLHYIQE